MVLTLHLSLFFFSGSYLGVLKILQRKTRFLEWFTSSLKWYFLPHKRLWASLNFLLYGLYVELWVG
jgi:hypothetical protein